MKECELKSSGKIIVKSLHPRSPKQFTIKIADYFSAEWPSQQSSKIARCQGDLKLDIGRSKHHAKRKCNPSPCDCALQEAGEIDM